MEAMDTLEKMEILDKMVETGAMVDQPDQMVMRVLLDHRVLLYNTTTLHDNYFC
jgi:hypothetical protein